MELLILALDRYVLESLLVWLSLLDSGSCTAFERDQRKQQQSHEENFAQVLSIGCGHK